MWTQTDVSEWTNGVNRIMLTVETVTPEIAKEWLKKNINNFRPKSDLTIAKLVESMPFWVVNGESISFDCLGYLRDGQHRLMACITSGCSFETVVVRGIDPKVDLTIGGAKPRTPQDYMRYKNEKNYTTLVSALRRLYQMDEGVETANGVIPTVKYDAILHANPGIRNSVDFICGMDKSFPLPGGIAAAVHFKVAQKSPSSADQFFKLVETGITNDVDDPARRLRERILDSRKSKAKLPGTYTFAIAIIAVNYWLQGRTCKILKWASVGPASAPFPKLNLDNIQV